MDNIRYFESPSGMFELTKEVFYRYYDGASEADFILLVFLLYHLREQIVAGQDYKEIDNTPPDARTEGQELFINLWRFPQFQIVRDICNGTKHHKTNKHLQKTEGFSVGFSRCGDQLDQRYFLIDGEDSRFIFGEVFNQYRLFFDQNSFPIHK